MRTSVGYSLLFLLSSSAVALFSRIDLTNNGTLSTSTSTPEAPLQRREQSGGRHSKREPISNHSRPLYFTLLSPLPIEWKVVDEDGSGHGNGTSKRHYPLRFSSYAYLHRASSPSSPGQSSTPTTDLKKNNNNSAPAPAGVEMEKKGRTPAKILMPLAENSTLIVPVTSTARAGITASPPSTIGTRRCEKLTDKQKYDLLESVGGRNQQFMANSPSEAGHFFPRLLPTDHHLSSSTTTNDFSEGDEIPNFDDVPGNEDDVVENSRGGLHSSPIDADYCDGGWCHEIEWKLADAIGRRAEGVVSRFHQDESNLTPVEQSSTQRREGSDGEGPNLGSDKQGSDRTKERESRLKKKPSSRCYLEKFIPIGNCTSHGEEEIWGHEKLCTACQGVYVLNEDCFPTFINAVICDKYDTKCIFDRYSGADRCVLAQGKCQTKSLSYKVMRNKGDEDGCEKWVFEYMDVPVACECHLSKTSWLEAEPPPEVRT